MQAVLNYAITFCCRGVGVGGGGRGTGERGSGERGGMYLSNTNFENG